MALLTDSGPGNAEGPWTITFDRLSGGTNDLVGPWVLEFDGP